MTFLKDDVPGPFKPQDQNLNSHLLPLFVSYRSNGEKLIKYQVNSSRVIMFVILMTTLFYKALILQGEIWCWSLFGLKGLKVTCPAKNSTCPGLLDRTFLESCNVWLGLQRHWHISEPWVFSTIQILIFEQRYHEVTIHKDMLHQQICVITDGL